MRLITYTDDQVKKENIGLAEIAAILKEDYSTFILWALPEGVLVWMSKQCFNQAEDKLEFFKVFLKNEHEVDGFKFVSLSGHFSN